MINGCILSCKNKIAFISEIPFFTRITILLALFLYIYSFIPYYPMHKIASLAKALFIDQSFSQFITFPFQHLGLAHLTFALIAYVPLACELERKVGTIRYTIKFILINAIIGIIHSCALYWYGRVFPKYYSFCINYPCAGLWPIIMVHMIERYYESPDALTDFLYLPIKIKAKFYPICFLVFYGYLFKYISEIVVGAIIGYISNVHIDLAGIFNKCTCTELVQSKIEYYFCKVFKFLGNFSMLNKVNFHHMPQESIEARDY